MISIRLKKGIAGVNGSYYFIAADYNTQQTYLDARIPANTSHWYNTGLKNMLIPAGLVYACGDNSQGGAGANSSYTSLIYPKLIPHFSLRRSANVTHIMCDPQNPSVMVLENGTIYHSGYLIYGNHGMGQGLQGNIYMVQGINTYGENSTDTTELLYMSRMFVSYINKSDGYLYATGRNICGQCCTGNTDAIDSWHKCNITNVKAIGETNGNVLALKNDGTVWTHLEHDPLDGGTWTQCSISDVKEICCTTYATIALKNDGTVWYTGVFVAGEMCMTAQTASDGNVGNTGVFAQISGLTEITHIGACLKNFVASKKNGNQNQLIVAGPNEYGQLGTGNGNAASSFITYNIDFEPEFISVGGGGTAITDSTGDVYIAGIGNYVFGNDKTYVTLNNQQCITTFTRVNEYCRTEDVNISSASFNLNYTGTIAYQTTYTNQNQLNITHNVYVKPCQYKISFDTTNAVSYTLENGEINPFFNPSLPFRSDIVLYVGYLEDMARCYIRFQNYGDLSFFTEANNTQLLTDTFNGIKTSLHTIHFQPIIDAMVNNSGIVFMIPNIIQTGFDSAARVSDYQDKIVNLPRHFMLRYVISHTSEEITRGGNYEYTIQCYVDNQLFGTCYANVVTPARGNDGFFGGDYYAVYSDIVTDITQAVLPANYPYTEGIVQLENRCIRSLRSNCLVPDMIFDIDLGHNFSTRVYIHFVKKENEHYCGLVSLDNFDINYSYDEYTSLQGDDAADAIAYLSSVITAMSQGNTYSYQYITDIVTCTHSNNSDSIVNTSAIMNVLNSLDTIMSSISNYNTYSYDNGIFTIVSNAVKNLKSTNGSVVVIVNGSELLRESFTLQGSTLTSNVDNIKTMNGTNSVYGSCTNKVINSGDNTYGLSDIDCVGEKLSNANTNVGVNGDLIYSFVLNYENNAYKLSLQCSTEDSVQVYNSSITLQQLSNVPITSIDEYCRTIRNWIENTIDSYVNANKCTPSNLTIGNTNTKVFANKPPVGTYFCIKSGDNVYYVKTNKIGNIYFKKDNVTYIA